MNLNFNDIKVLVVGDFMVDNYLFCHSNRLSPEAPVPVLLPLEEVSKPGGAANVAINLSKLGAKVSSLGVVGDDKWGSWLINELKLKKINTELIQKDQSFETILKKRLYNKKKQVARIDYEKIQQHNQINNLFEEVCNDYDIVILSDYNKGVLSGDWLKSINCKKLLLADPKNSDLSHYRKANIITPNLKELEKSCGEKIDNDQKLISQCNKIIKENNFDYIVVTQGADGLTIVGQSNFYEKIKAHEVENPDVSGAGDTFISALSLSFAKTKNISLSAKFANLAASIAVSKIGTSSVKIDEVNSLFLK